MNDVDKRRNGIPEKESEQWNSTGRELGNDEPIPFVAVPNMRKPDGSLRSFSLDEILEALRFEGEE